MYEPGRPKEITVTGPIGEGTATQTIKGVSLTAGVDAASATIRAGGVAGTVVLVVKAPIQTTVPVPLQMAIADPYVTLTGTSPSFTALL